MEFMFETISLLILISIAAIVTVDIKLLRKYEYYAEKGRLKLWIKADLIVASVVFIIALLLFFINLIEDPSGLSSLTLVFLSAFLILGILALPWIIYGGYLLLRPMLKK